MPKLTARNATVNDNGTTAAQDIREVGVIEDEWIGSPWSLKSRTFLVAPSLKNYEQNTALSLITTITKTYYRTDNKHIGKCQEE